MAEIKVEKKKSVWPWVLIILAILLALFLLFMFSDGNDDDIDDIEENDDIEQVEQYDRYENTDNEYPDNAVAQYLAYIDRETDEQLEEDPTPAVMRLNEAVEEIALELRYDLEEDLDVRDTTATGEFAETPTGTEADIRTSGEKIINALAEIRENRFIDREELDAEIDELRNELNEISEDAAGESEAISDFFHQAAEILREMNIDVDTTPPDDTDTWQEAYPDENGNNTGVETDTTPGTNQ